MVTYMKNLVKAKGSYGYIMNRKAYTSIRTLVYFIICVGLYAMGYLTTESNKKILTVVAILGCLPACKSLVNMIMFLKIKGCSEELKNKVCGYDKILTTFYDLYFTTYQKNFAVSHMVLKGNVLCGITEDIKCDTNEAEKHLEQMLTQEGIKNVTVKIFSNPGKYVDRLSQLKNLETEEHRDRESIINLLYSISL